MLEKIKHYLDYFHRDVEKEIERFAKSIPEGSLVLDAGAGEGKYREYFSHCRVIGVDNCVGDSSWDYSSLDVVGDLHLLPFKDNSFDFVICVVVFEHLKNPFKAMRELSRVLKKNGKMFAVFPFMWELHQRPYDFFRYSEYGFKQMAEDVELSVVEIKQLGCFFRVLHYMVASMLKECKNNISVLLLTIIFLPYLLLFLFISDIIDRLTGICNYTPGYSIILKK
ncbi:conserved hypothetical protein [Thermotomaculum hydrothermale]|uniref:Methyltransferase type 11 domain-containing protein n=1 Tax=Thermotomaculum hydrothermale TaxID=981385 RepID=A0A7R6PTI6_9BACT|nr:class I SAM-dependent methyltransferase [Thermotomaculum hydrothermale]BBB32367.1 conserved hypothetical protein [Thermotomaculum hydrothermale]